MSKDLDSAGRVYAEALLSEAWSRHRGQEALDALRGLVNDILPRDPDLEAFLCAPGGGGREQREAVLKSAFDGRADDFFVDFLLVLNRHDRLNLLRNVLSAYEALYDRRQNRSRVEVRSAAPLPDDQRERLLAQLRGVMKREPVLDVQVDPTLIGGLVVRIDDWLYDASARSQVEAIRDRLTERSSHVIESGRDRVGAAG